MIISLKLSLLVRPHDTSLFYTKNDTTAESLINIDHLIRIHDSKYHFELTDNSQYGFKELQILSYISLNMNFNNFKKIVRVLLMSTHNICFYGDMKIIKWIPCFSGAMAGPKFFNRIHVVMSPNLQGRGH